MSIVQLSGESFCGLLKFLSSLVLGMDAEVAGKFLMVVKVRKDGKGMEIMGSENSRLVTPMETVIPSPMSGDSRA